ncbi:LOW QUALITY PROTEIN: hypothetical protein HZS_6428 [Henneguya salminicola]|nr:LOW QUALITY PROTEIN: hypothetical protein HZS_6428 [Henneguya salminicola]
MKQIYIFAVFMHYSRSSKWRFSSKNDMDIQTTSYMAVTFTLRNLLIQKIQNFYNIQKNNFAQNRILNIDSSLQYR